MTNHADLIAALRIPMDVTLRRGAPELDVYDEQRKAAADALEAVWAEGVRVGVAREKLRALIEWINEDEHNGELLMASIDTETVETLCAIIANQGERR